MARKPKHSAATVKLSLAGVLDLKEATPLTERLLANRGRDIEIDGSAVQRLGAQCLQVLLAARRTWMADGRRFIVADVSQSVVTTLELLGVSPADLNHVPEGKA